MTLNSRLTVNAGLLMNRDDLIQDIPGINTGTNIESGTFLTFGFGDQLQPRIGFNYQLRKSVGDKVYGNYGRYYGLDQKSGARSMASGRLYTEDADFDPITGALISKTTAANTAAKSITRPITSPYMDEVLFGYATPLSDGWSLDSFFMYRDTDNFIEDIPTVLPFSSFTYKNDPIADRKYKTFTIELNRNLKGHLGDEHELRLEQALRELRSGLFRRPRGRGGLQHVIAPQRRSGIVHGGHEPAGSAESGSSARVQGAGNVEPAVGGQPDSRPVGSLAERNAVGRARSAARQRRHVSQLPGAGGNQP
jgi:hypothetical protein